MARRDPQTIEQTDKRWKACQAIGVVMMLVGGLLSCAAVGASGPGNSTSGSMVFAMLILFGGLGTWIFGGVAAWWYHG